MVIGAPTDLGSAKKRGRLLIDIKMSITLSWLDSAFDLVVNKRFASLFGKFLLFFSKISSKIEANQIEGRT
ncbi:MAG: hypothetical protein O3B09_01660 [Proteobacteria bacterium]|nr:hypothetical protein [Pseudomonadota bacterium]